MSSTLTCRMDHAFPWRYRYASFNTGGHLICPSCETELECVWAYHREAQRE
jgi:hypothetical protein